MPSNSLSLKVKCMEFDKGDAGPVPPKSRRRKTIFTGVASIIVLIILGILLGFFIAGGSSRAARVPENIASAFSSQIYLPKKLPGNYQLVENSFGISEDVLIFQAKDSAGSTIIFTEQAKPGNLDFDNFYSRELTDSQVLSDVPFPSVTGKSSANNSTALSIVTDNTWVFVTSQSSLSKEDLQVIAKNMQLHKN